MPNYYQMSKFSHSIYDLIQNVCVETDIKVIISLERDLFLTRWYPNIETYFGRSLFVRGFRKHPYIEFYPTHTFSRQVLQNTMQDTACSVVRLVPLV